MSAPRCVGGVAVDYRKVSIRLGEANTWCRLSGVGAEGSPAIRRTWRHAACLALPASLVSDLERLHGAANVHHAVVRLAASGDVQAGPLPAGVHFGHFDLDEPTQLPRRTLLCRVGPSSMLETAMPAFILPKEGLLLVPQKAEILAERISPEDSLRWTKTGTPLV